MVPAGKLDPLVCVEVNEETVQLSLAVGAVQVATLLQVPGAMFMVISEGMPEITGAILSLTVMVKEAVLTFPEASVAV